MTEVVTETWVSISEASKALKLSRQQITTARKKGALPEKKAENGKDILLNISAYNSSLVKTKASKKAKAPKVAVKAVKVKAKVKPAKLTLDDVVENQKDILAGIEYIVGGFKEYGADLEVIFKTLAILESSMPSVLDSLRAINSKIGDLPKKKRFGIF